MPKLELNNLMNSNLTKLSGVSLKKEIEKMLANSSQCKAIFETVNQDTGEYRIVLQGIIDQNPTS